MNQSIYFYVLRDGMLIARKSTFQDAFDLVRDHQVEERGNISRPHYNIIKGCEQGVPYVEVTQ